MKTKRKFVNVVPKSKKAINRFCADAVDIPYASDNFTDEEWEQFKTCVKFMKQYEE